MIAGYAPSSTVSSRHRRRADRIPARDESLHGLVVVRTERPVRLEPRAAERRLDRLGRRAARAEADERLAGDVAERRRGRRRAAIPRRRRARTGRAAARPSRAARRRPGAGRSRRRSRRARGRPRSPRRRAPRASRRSAATAPVKRRMISGRTRAPADWKVPTRSVPASPAWRAWRSAWAACSRATIESACRRRSWPASVSDTGRGPPGRSTSCSPTIRSSVAIC